MSFVQQARAYQEHPQLIEGLLVDEPESYCETSTVDLYREELYSLLAIMVNDIMDVFEDDSVPYFPPYGFLGLQSQEVSELDSFMQAYAALRQTFQILGSGYITTQEKAETPIYQRTDVLCGRFHDTFPNMGQYESVANLLGAGINTAALVTIESLKAVSRVAQTVNPDVTNEEVAEIARHSERMLYKTASLPLSQIFGIELLINSAANDSRDPGVLDCHPLVYRQIASGQGYVDYVGPISEMIDPTDSQQRVLHESRPSALRRLGCPALAHLDGAEPNVVQRLWRHMIDVAEAEELFTMAPDVYLRIAA